MMVTARFEGMERDIGYEHGVVYSLKIEQNGDRLCIFKTDGSSRCEYCGFIPFLRHWKLIEVFDQKGENCIYCGYPERAGIHHQPSLAVYHKFNEPGRNVEPAWQQTLELVRSYTNEILSSPVPDPGMAAAHDYKVRRLATLVHLLGQLVNDLYRSRKDGSR